MLGRVHHVGIGPRDIDDLEYAMRSMPAHPDVAPALQQLADAGYRLTTLTNSPTIAGQPSPVKRAD